MAKLVVQLGALCVVVKDDRATLKGEDLKEWRRAVSNIVTDVSKLAPVEEEVEDGE